MVLTVIVLNTVLRLVSLINIQEHEHVKFGKDQEGHLWARRLVSFDGLVLE